MCSLMPLKCCAPWKSGTILVRGSAKKHLKKVLEGSLRGDMHLWKCRLFCITSISCLDSSLGVPKWRYNNQKLSTSQLSMLFHHLLRVVLLRFSVKFYIKSPAQEKTENLVVYDGCCDLNDSIFITPFNSWPDVFEILTESNMLPGFGETDLVNISISDFVGNILWR